MQTFNIQPFPLTQTATQLRVRVTNTTDTVCEAYYELVRADGRVMETGVKTFPRTALAIIGQDPINKAGLNQLLAAWGLAAL